MVVNNLTIDKVKEVQSKLKMAISHRGVKQNKVTIVNYFFEHYPAKPLTKFEETLRGDKVRSYASVLKGTNSRVGNTDGLTTKNSNDSGVTTKNKRVGNPNGNLDDGLTTKNSRNDSGVTANNVTSQRVDTDGVTTKNRVGNTEGVTTQNVTSKKRVGNTEGVTTQNLRSERVW